ncbi:MAG: hypothetical protein WAN87_02365 [Thermoplasmata archaeon]
MTAAKPVRNRNKSLRRRPRKSGSKIPKGFVGRSGSPVLDRYPAKDPSLGVKGPPPRTSTAPPALRPSPSASSVAPPESGSDTSTPPLSLISLERPFDIDEFSQLLGETAIRVTVPREDLADALKRVSEFMGFGIYIYSIKVRPGASDLLKEFVVELQRVDFNSQKGDWVPFEDKGASDSPFGPTGRR